MSPIYPNTDAEDTNSSGSQEQSTENNYSDVDLEITTESDTKSSNSLDCTNSDDVVASEKITNVIQFENYHNSADNVKKKSFPTNCCSIVYLSVGLMLLTGGLLMIAIPLYDFVLIERLKMQPGLPPYEQWVIPQPEVRLSVYIFSVENAYTFLNGTDDKLRLNEIGPIVYREHLHHKNIEFHGNSTLSYTAARRIEFLDDQNEPGILNRTILVPNFVLLASAASINDNFFKKVGFNFLLENTQEPLFINITIYDYLWKYKSDIIKKLSDIAPFLVPTNNSGVLHQIYADFNDRYNVRIGPDYGPDHFFEITSVNGGTVVPGFNLEYGECNASIIGSTEGALYKTHLTEDTVLWYWRKALCRQVPLHFEQKIQKGSFEAYKYVLRENVYDRTENLTDDCFSGFYETLPNGLSDVSKCFYDMPFAASNPHFYGRYPNELTTKLEGFHPIKDKHQSFIIVEPIMGIPIDQSARSQSNVVIPNLTGFSQEIERFSNMALPTFWVEYHQKRLTSSIENLLYFTLFILPPLQYLITTLFLIGGLGLFTTGLLRCSSVEAQTLFIRRKSKSKYDANCKMHENSLTWQTEKKHYIQA